MLPKPESVYLAIADISGYTSFIAQSELDHAQDIIADLMSTIVKCLRPPFRLAKFEGDAVFVYAPTDRIDGSALMDAIDSAYFAFCKRLRDISRATSCECSACSAIRGLDLKFVCHHGELIRQKMAGREELAGRDVIIVHRLLKNSVSERLGGNAYALYSDGCIQAMGIDPQTADLQEYVESIDIIGEIRCRVRDLGSAWKAQQLRQPQIVTADKAAMVLQFDIAAPRPTVWEYFTLPGQRPRWRGADSVREAVQSGRRGIGTTNHCMHGDHVILEEVMDWQPFDYLTLTTLLPMPDAPKVLMTYAFFEREDGGTHIEIRIGKAKPKDRAFLDHVGEVFRKDITVEIANLRLLLEHDAGLAVMAGEPQAPASAGRFLAQRVT